jgi:lipoprotein-releasing system permease protein
MRTLMGMGATPSTVRGIFFGEGVLIVMMGTVIGLGVGLGICWAQQQFGFVRLAGSVVEAYPVKVITTDLLAVAAAVLTIGLFASWVPLRTLSRRFLQATSANA